MKLPFNVLALDLNSPDLVEDQSYSNPDKYGGGACVNREFLRNFDNFYIAGRKECFINVPDEKRSQCFILSEESILNIKGGAPLSLSGIPLDFLNSIDLIFHQFTNIFVDLSGLKAKTLVWAVGVNDLVHPLNQHLALYSFKHQKPLIYNPQTVTYSVCIGKRAPEFIERDKEDFIFQCSRHNNSFGSIEVAKWCLVNKIKGYFAGPLENGYDLKKYIDNQNTFYLGLISEKDKLHYTSRARLYTLLFDWDAPFNLSLIESLQHGTPVISTHRGFVSEVISNGVNGFLSRDLNYAWDNAPILNQKDCYDSVSLFSSEKMIERFVHAFDYRLKN